MSDVERLEAELELAKLAEKLEDARDKMHAHRTAATIKTYKEASKKVADARRDYRENHRSAPQGDGDAAPSVGTVRLKAGVNK